MMKKNLPLKRIIIYQNLGFLGIICLCYLDDLLKLPAIIFSSNPFEFVYRRTTLEMLMVLGVWFVVTVSTRRILARLRYLEEFMRVCAWCRRINYHGEWMRMEEFMRQGFDTPTTHGICMECFQQQQAAIETAKQKRLNVKKEPVAK
jgi:hypothetical protein